MKKILYLGTSPSNYSCKENLIHYPVIRLIPKSIDEKRVLFCLRNLDSFSHCILTSKNSVEILWDLCLQLSLEPASSLQGKCISIGAITSDSLSRRGVVPAWQALEASQEGLIESFQGRFEKGAYVLYPRSSLARPFLNQYLIENNISHETLDLYDIVYQAPTPKPLLNEIKEIVFTSPSTVEGFFRAFQEIPKNVRISFQGPVTKFFFTENFSRLINLNKKR